MTVESSTYQKGLFLFCGNLLLFLLTIGWEITGRKEKTALLIAKETPYCLTENQSQMVRYSAAGTELRVWHGWNKTFALETFIPNVYLPLRCLPTWQGKPSLKMSIDGQFYTVYPDDKTDFQFDKKTGEIKLHIQNINLPTPNRKFTLFINFAHLLPLNSPLFRQHYLNESWQNYVADANQPNCRQHLEQDICIWLQNEKQYPTSLSFTSKTIHFFLNHNKNLQAVAINGELFFYFSDNVSVKAKYNPLFPLKSYQQLKNDLEQRYQGKGEINLDNLDANFQYLFL